MLRFILVTLSTLALTACNNDRGDIPSKTPPATRTTKFDFANVASESFSAAEIKAYAMEGTDQETKKVVIVAKAANGDFAELHIQDIDKEYSSFNVENGAAASFSYTAHTNENLSCTTALTMDNDSSVNIEQHDPITNYLKGSLNGFDCLNTAGPQSINAGKFEVTYEDITPDHDFNLKLGEEDLTPDMVYVTVSPAPINTIQITGFNGGTESYTLILKKGLTAGVYAMNEFDVTPYFFYSDAEHNQFETIGGEVTIDSYDPLERIIKGSFHAQTTDGSNQVACSGSFEVFIF